MARTTAPSLWLPGFDPDEPALPDLSPEGDLFAEYLAPDASQATAATSAAGVLAGTETDAEVRSERHSSPSRASWRVVVGAKRDEPRTLWPPLRREHLSDLNGAVTKFEANLAAARALQSIELAFRTPDATERCQLLRFTGWGGLPAAFNLEGNDPAWRARAEELQALLPADDYASARASVNNSHYTEVHMIEAMWQAVERFGFTGGRVLEPAAGVGHFLGAMPRSLAERSAVTAIEIDRLSGRMLQALYAPHGADVRIAPFEKVALPENWFDLVIGNVPFGNYPAADAGPKPYARFRIHNYFFGRALDLVRPGGLVCFITSTGTMEARDDAVREYVASQAKLLGAIRLPRGAFAGLASTDVQTDILFLGKRHPGEAVSGAWMERVLVPDGLRHPRCPHKYLQINAWYARNPGFCIGQVTQESNGYEEVPTVAFEGDLESALAERIALLPSGVYTPAKPVVLASVRAAVPAEPGARPGSFRVHHGRVHRVEGAELVDLHDSLNATQRVRIAGMCAIRDHARALLDAQLAQDGDEGLAQLRAMLNGTYDRYVSRHGCLSTRANALAFRRDPDYPLLLSLEHYDEESDTARKAALFTQRTLRRVSAPTAVAEPTEALAASVQWPGRSRLHGPAAVGARGRSAGHALRGRADLPGSGRRRLEDRGRLPVGQRQGQAQAGCPLGPGPAPQCGSAGARAARGPAARFHRAAPGRGLDTGGRRRGLHPRSAGAQGLPGVVLGRGRGLVGDLPRMERPTQRQGDPGMGHSADERHRAGAGRAERAGTDGARPRSGHGPLPRQSSGNAGGAGEVRVAQGPLRGMGF
ncbi:Eco57I restriction-modification methylase domain-containing protein [Diaphorobacter sp.]|uniref:Eco57I restriction-modification methylase domain-containing protein n=1 Tax=Diaphorobacter sp. TaxID=1934310 RepID=UPI003916D8E8